MLSYFFTFFCKETGGSENLNLISPEQKAVPLGLLLSQHADNFHSHSSEAQLAHQLQAPWLFMWSMISRKISLKLDIVKKKKGKSFRKNIFLHVGGQNLKPFKPALLKRPKNNLIHKHIYANELYLSNEYLYRQNFKFKNLGIIDVVI